MKIIQVINAMISKKEKISNVILSSNSPAQEYFFIFDNKHKWSILKDKSSNYILHFYPTNNYSIEELSINEKWQEIPYITYKSKEIKTQEADESFNELYQIVSNKLYNLDDVFDEIIKS